MISKELLIAVLKDYEKGTYTYFNDTFKYIQYTNTSGFDRKINIYELAHMVKEWAYKNGYEIFSGKSIDCYSICIEKVTGFAMDYGYTINSYFDSKSEPEAISKAGEYILKELNND